MVDFHIFKVVQMIPNRLMHHKSEGAKKTSMIRMLG